MTTHYVRGCAWASGEIHGFDTIQTKVWSEVTCKHCLKRRPKEMTWFVYIVECSDGTFYTGYTNDVYKRIATHNYDKGSQCSKYTKTRRPVKLVFYEEYPTKSDALKREYAIKQLSREEKQKLISIEK